MIPCRKRSRSMDRSRRTTNPSNYNADGTIRKGIRLQWTYSARYDRLRKKRKELYRKRAVLIKMSHETLANEILERSTTVICETMNYRALQTRSKNTTRNARNGKFTRKLRFGKALANHAPSMFERILDQKLHYIGKELARPAKGAIHRGCEPLPVRPSEPPCNRLGLCSSAQLDATRMRGDMEAH